MEIAPFSFSSPRGELVRSLLHPFSTQRDFLTLLAEVALLLSLLELRDRNENISYRLFQTGAEKRMHETRESIG